MHAGTTTIAVVAAATLAVAVQKIVDKDALTEEHVVAQACPAPRPCTTLRAMSPSAEPRSRPGGSEPPVSSASGERASVEDRYQSLFVIGRGGMGTVEVALER